MPQISFKDQVVVVTGAGAGLGRAYALEFGRRGAAVVVNDPGFLVDGSARSNEPADLVVQEIRAAGGTAVANYDPVGTLQAGEALVATAVDAFGRIDALVNNAGMLRSADLEDLTPDDLDAMIQVHVGGAVWPAQAAFCRMKEQKYGRVVFVGSGAAMFGNLEQTAYTAAKGAVFGFATTFALEAREHGILSNTLLPAAVTRMAGVRKRALPELTAAMGAIRVRLTEQHVMPLVAYLASSACQSTGEVYSACGGRYARAVIGLTGAGSHRSTMLRASRISLLTGMRSAKHAT